MLRKVSKKYFQLRYLKWLLFILLFVWASLFPVVETYVYRKYLKTNFLDIGYRRELIGAAIRHLWYFSNVQNSRKHVALIMIS